MMINKVKRDQINLINKNLYKNQLITNYLNKCYQMIIKVNINNNNNNYFNNKQKIQILKQLIKIIINKRRKNYSHLIYTKILIKIYKNKIKYKMHNNKVNIYYSNKVNHNKMKDLQLQIDKT